MMDAEEDVAHTLRQALTEAQDSVHELRGELYAVGYERDATGEALAEAREERDGVVAERDALRRKLDAAMKVLGLKDGSHARYNLDGAITDIDHAGGFADAVVMRTLRRVRGQLAEVEHALAALEST